MGDYKRKNTVISSCPIHFKPTGQQDRKTTKSTCEFVVVPWYLKEIYPESNFSFMNFAK